MKKQLALIIILCPMLAFAQPWHITLFGGLSNYQGDLQSKKYTFSESKGAFGIGAQYDINNHFSLRGGLMLGKVGADDKNSSDSYRKARNLNFQSNITEGNIMLQYDLIDLSVHRLSPYAFLGIGVYHFNPYSYDTLGRKVYLQPLSTEGEGLSQYPGRKVYGLTQFTVPFGGGLHFRISDNVVLGYEIGIRPAFTDYLDDVSTTYVDPNVLLAAKGPLAVAMSYRGDEIKNSNPNYPDAGVKRGNPGRKDWYYFSGFSLSIGLGSGGGGRTPKSMGCPGRVW